MPCYREKNNVTRFPCVVGSNTRQRDRDYVPPEDADRPFDLEEYAVQHFGECAPLSPLEIRPEEPDAAPELDKLKFYLRSAMARAEAQESKINFIQLPKTKEELDEFEVQLKAAMDELDELRKKFSADGES